MTDLFLGQTNTEQYRFISGGVANTFTFSFQPDKVVFNNLTAWASGTIGLHPFSVWFRDQTDDGEAFEANVVENNGAEGTFNWTERPILGFTVADTTGGVAESRSLISGVTEADPCVVTTSSAHGLQTNQLVRITDLGSDMPIARGMDQINNLRFRIIVLTTTTFSLKDPITDDGIDSSNFTSWVSGGRVELETHVLQLNNPQVDPYSNSNPYLSNPYSYDPITYQLTADTGVMGSDGDIFNIEVYKFGAVTDLGDLGA